MDMYNNEFQEIQSTLLTLMKACNQYMPALGAISNLPEMYGHQPIQLIFTDNVWGDKAKLEKVISSLRADVVPVLDISSLEKLTIPAAEWNVSTLSSTFQVNTWINSFLDKLNNDDELLMTIGMAFPIDHVNGIQGKVFNIIWTWSWNISAASQFLIIAL